MKYNRLGQTGLFVSEICLGTMTFSGENYFGGVIGTLGQKEATALIARSLEARVNFIDTANVYSFGESEKMTGQALKDLGVKRSDVVLATKVYGRMGPGPMRPNTLVASTTSLRLTPMSLSAWPVIFSDSPWQ